MSAYYFIHIFTPCKIANLHVKQQTLYKYSFSTCIYSRKNFHMTGSYVVWIGNSTHFPSRPLLEIISCLWAFTKASRIFFPLWKSTGILMHKELKRTTTWLPVSMLFSWWPFVVFQKRIHLSAVPPPDARRPLWWGDQEMALTAAVCSVSLKAGCWECWFQTNS